MKKLLLLIIPIFICFVIFLLSFNHIDIGKSVNGTDSQTPPTIIIDAGHGGFDGGASTDDGVPEKDINLSISLYLEDYLHLFGYDVIMTRNKDTSLEDDSTLSIRKKKTSDIRNRLKLMETTENSIFISIHQNHFHQEKYSGMQVFYSKNHSESSSLLAQSIQDSTVNLLQPENERQIKQIGTSVFLIYNAVRPAVLVECGFLSNKEESEKLKTETYQKQIAFSIALGIIDYINS